MDHSLTHFDKKGNAVMVDVSQKEITNRTAIAQGCIYASDAVLQAIAEGTVAKGDVLGVARVAGILGTKQCPHLIPMCHPLLLTQCTIDFTIDKQNHCITAQCTVTTDGKTGVEMEALTGVSVALLTIYDMCKAMDKKMELSNLHLVQKTGGKSGVFRYEE